MRKRNIYTCLTVSDRKIKERGILDKKTGILDRKREERERRKKVSEITRGKK